MPIILEIKGPGDNQISASNKTYKIGIRQKVLIILLMVLLTALSVSGWLALKEEKENIVREIKQRGGDISRFVSKSLVYSVIGYDYHTIDLILKDITEFEEIVYGKVVNAKGNTMSEQGEVIAGDRENVFVFNENIKLNEEVIGVLTLGFSNKNVLKRIEEQKYALISREALIILLIAIGEFIALSYIIIKPIGIISSSLKEREDEEKIFLKTIPIPSNDEFGELAKQFNKLSHNLNMANSELQSRVEYADKELIKTNNLLLERSAELMDMNEKFKKLSITDPLTELYNRRYFEDALKDELEAAKRYGDVSSLIIIDIDHFKKINDLYGHNNGDVIIKMIADTMKARLRESDIVCRIGGEEFVAICKRADKAASLVLAESLRKTVVNTVTILNGHEVKVTVSVGIATASKENIDEFKDNIFRYADESLYHSKQQGRNCITHCEDII